MHFNCWLETVFHFFSSSMPLVHSQAKQTILFNTIRFPMTYKTEFGAFGSMTKRSPWSNHCQHHSLISAGSYHVLYALPTPHCNFTNTPCYFSPSCLFVTLSCLLGIPSSLLRVPPSAFLSLTQSLTKGRLAEAECPSTGNKWMQCLQNF